MTTSVADRRKQLVGLLAEIRTRRTSDTMGDSSEILGRLKDGIASLSSPQMSETVIGSTGMEANSRSVSDRRARTRPERHSL